MIELIDINKIYEHPNNPRKSLGDLEELADSISESGILQNLTLVKRAEDISGETYTVIIGHRRLSAAKLAGLTEVPCTIAMMDEKTQVATMLLENMQRVDLTIYEQAQGFQMMIDLGESIKDISDKTGFSESTVRRRTRLLDFDQEKLKESDERGGTLADYARLEEIESDELRNKVLETVGTSDFNWELKRAVSKEEDEKKIIKAIEDISKFAIEIVEEDNMTHTKSYHSYNLENIEAPEDWKERQYYFKNHDTWLALYKESETGESKNKEEEERKLRIAEREQKTIKIEKITNRSYELRQEFIKGISNTKAKRHMDAIIEATIYGMGTIYGITSNREMAQLFETEIEEESNQWKQIQKVIWKQPEKNLLNIVYNALDDGHQDYHRWNLAYQENEKLDYVYELLEKLGYKLSEEEREIKKGTHELFQLEMEV